MKLALTRRLRRLGNSLVVTIPSQIAEMCGLEEGQDVEVEAIGRDALRIVRAHAP